MKKLIGMLTCLAVAVAGAAEMTVAGKDWKNIQSAIDKVAEQGGGRVTLPAGEWISDTIRLRNNVELHLAKGAVLKGSVNKNDYNKDDEFPENFNSVGEEWSGAHLILGYKVENASITGEGVIDGNGLAFFSEECDEDSRWPFYKYGLKLHPTDREWFRPGPMVAFFLSKNIRIEGVKMVNQPAWGCHVRCTDGLIVRNVTVDADRTIANSDGFSIDCTRNVVIEGCTMRTGDDSLAIRASCKLHAATNFCENIRVSNCDFWSCCFGIRFGIGSGTIRNVVVDNVRVHEAANSAFNFTPAWVSGKRNCYIEDITLTNCTASECVFGVGGSVSPFSKVDKVRFVDCTFNTLLPLRIHPWCGMHFERCTRNTINKFKVRHHRDGSDQGIRRSKHYFIKDGANGGVTEKDCFPRPFGSQGVLMLAFDDRNFADWDRAIPIFRKYGAHASFFISGEFDSAAVATAKRLIAEGHSIGLHGQNHGNVPDMIKKYNHSGWWSREIETPKRQAEVAYIPIRSFAYPNNLHTDATDGFLKNRFERLRVGVSGVRPYDAARKLDPSKFKPLATEESLFFPVKELPKRYVLGGIILGEAYHTDIDDVVAAVRRAGERKEAILFTSHGISPDAKGIHMKTAWLEQILAEAKKQNMLVLGFDELP